jgi:hypothetical protein
MTSYPHCVKFYGSFPPYLRVGFSSRGYLSRSFFLESNDLKIKYFKYKIYFVGFYFFPVFIVKWSHPLHAYSVFFLRSQGFEALSSLIWILPVELPSLVLMFRLVGSFSNYLLEVLE